MELSLTAVFKKVPEGYIAFVEELPGANTQGAVNRQTRKTSTVPRHREINEHLARKICRDLEIPVPAA